MKVWAFGRDTTTTRDSRKHHRQVGSRRLAVLPRWTVRVEVRHHYRCLDEYHRGLDCFDALLAELRDDAVKVRSGAGQAIDLGHEESVTLS
jgi:hypothetical protein